MENISSGKGRRSSGDIMVKLTLYEECSTSLMIVKQHFSFYLGSLPTRR